MAYRSREDELHWTDEYILLPADYLQIKGLDFFGHAKFNKAQVPVPAHYHLNCREITVMVSGSQRYWAEEREYPLYAGDVFINAANEIHSSGDEPQGVSDKYYFGLNVENGENFCGLASPFDQILFERIKNWDKRVVRVSEEDVQTLGRSFDYFLRLVKNKNDVESRLHGLSLFLTFLNQFLSAEAETRSDESAITEILSYIRKHITEQLKVEELVKMSGLSGTQFRFHFKAKTGLAPKEYINREKIELAKAMLRQETNPSMTELAYGLGFPASANFSALFCKFVGCSPSEYHKKWKK